MHKNRDAHMAAAGSTEAFSALPRTEGAAHTQTQQITRPYSLLIALPPWLAALWSAALTCLSAPFG